MCRKKTLSVGASLTSRRRAFASNAEIRFIVLGSERTQNLSCLLTALPTLATPVSKGRKATQAIHYSVCVGGQK